MLVALLTCPHANAQQAIDRKAAIGKPTPQSMRIQVVKGQTVRITLSSKTVSKTAAVEYVVRDFPKLGILASPSQTPEDRTKATIIYQAASQSKGQLDVFSFSARYPDGYFSAPVRIIIELSDPKPQIEAPPSIDFGSMVLGDEVIREILLKNSGNIEFRKLIQLPAPLELIEPVDGILMIEPGHSAVIKIKCQPKKVAAFHLSHTFYGKSATAFIGNAFAPFIVTPTELKLRWNDLEQRRQGNVRISNKSNTSLSIKIRPPIRSQYLHEKQADNALTNSPLILPPGKTQIVTIALPTEDVQNFKANLAISAGQYTQNIPLEASPSPPDIHIELPDPTLEEINFGAANPGTIVSRTFMIKNQGGTASLIGLGVQPPFRIAKNQATSPRTPYSVAPESSATFTVDFVAPAQQFGFYSDTLQVKTDVSTFSIRITALVNDPDPMTDQTLLPPQIKKDLQDKSKSIATAATEGHPLPPPSRLPPPTRYREGRRLP